MDFIKRDDTVLVVIDFQEKLMPVMQGKEELEERAQRLIKGMKALGIPAVVTQQYTKGIGKTIKAISETLGDFEHIEKTSFGCMNNEEFAKTIRKTDKKNVVVCGIEAHICVMQTVLQLIEKGYRVYLAADCVSSRNKTDKLFAIQRMRDAGAVITTYEAILYEILEDSKAEGFKEISKIVK